MIPIKEEPKQGLDFIFIAAMICIALTVAL